MSDLTLVVDSRQVSNHLLCSREFRARDLAQASLAAALSNRLAELLAHSEETPTG